MLAAVGAAAAAGFMYGRTLLPGLDLGDTASFQTIVTLPLVVPRHAYPLYVALGKLSVLALGGDPAHALNVLSAVAATGAVAAYAWLAWELTADAFASLWGSLLFAASYTFWSQAVIAEVYTLQALFIAVVLACAVRWWREPSRARLAALYAVYALSFGNHLSMILLAPALVWLLWTGRVKATDSPFAAAGIALALAIAAAGALQYGWNLYGLRALTAPSRSAAELLATFWFDVTKADWRESLVGTVRVDQWGQRAAMYWWDARQQFGVAGLAVALAGAVALLRASRATGVALLAAYLTTFIFGFFYNVGDTHVFLLPSHQIVATFAAVGAAVVTRAASALRPGWCAAALALFFALPAWRIADTWPAVDRSDDRRAEQYVAAALAGLTPHATVYLGDENWQTQNAVDYELVVRRPELPRALSSAVMWHLPEFVERNAQLGRDVVLTAAAAQNIRAVYASTFPIKPDEAAPVSTLEGALGTKPGTPYVLAVLTPLSSFLFDAAMLQRVARAVGGIDLPRGRYVVMAGVAGSAPTLLRAADRPFRETTRLPCGRVEIRIEAWLPFDTMRRAGFGHVFVNGQKALTLERGAAFAALAADGRPLATAYQGGSFSLQPRYRIPVLR